MIYVLETVIATTIVANVGSLWKKIQGSQERRIWYKMNSVLIAVRRMMEVFLKSLSSYIKELKLRRA